MATQAGNLWRNEKVFTKLHAALHVQHCCLGTSDTHVCFQVQLCYAMAIIAVTMCMTLLTPIANRNSLLWCSPLLQLLPVCAMAFNQSW